MAGFLDNSYGGLVGGGMPKGNVNLATTASNATTMIAVGFIPFHTGAFLNKGDVLQAIHPTDEGDDTTNIAQWFAVASANDPIQLTTLEAFVGSAEGEQAVGFQRTSLTGSIGGGGAFNLFAYQSGIDDMVAMIATGYFNNGYDILSVGDVICVSALQGANPRGADLLKVTDITNGVVTVVATLFALKA